jgi:hypothetical protein
MDSCATDAANAIGRVDTEVVDLCVVGAGLAGLNALWVATEYLPPGARVALIDRHPRCGGMWTETYDFVRLHQPHPYFTVGDIPWEWDKPTEYLAKKHEILAHLEYCLKLLKQKFSLLELFGYEVDADQIFNLVDRPGIGVPCTPLDPALPIVGVRAKRVIIAHGNMVPPAAPLTLASNAVASATPVDLPHHLARDRKAPVYIVGGGKTGMDCAQQIITTQPDRPVSIVAGRGTAFFDRDHLAPLGLRRWWKGKLSLEMYRDIAMQFDGSNYDETFAHFRRKYALCLSGSAEHCFFGNLSKSELETVQNGIDEKIEEYLTDVIDTPCGPALLYRSGAIRPVDQGSIIVNCTGFLLRGDAKPIDRVSRGSTLLNISSQGSLHFLSSVSAYFLTHLFFSDRRSKAPVYAIDADALFAIDRRAWFVASVIQALMNPLLLLNALSIRTFDRCGLNTDRHFPFPRIIANLATVQYNRRKYIDHCRHSLDVIANTYGVRCGEICWN